MARTPSTASFGADGDTMAVTSALADRLDNLVARTNELTRHLHEQVSKTAPEDIIEWAPDTIRLNGCILLLTRLSDSLDTIRDLAQRGTIQLPALLWIDDDQIPDQSRADLTESIGRLQDDVETLSVDLTFLVNGLIRLCHK